MKSTKRTLPRGTPYDERAIALAIRLRLIDPPTRPLSDITEEGWKQLWFAIGMELAEKEPEFKFGRGRRPGSKSRKPRVLVSTVSDAAKRQRRHREKKRAADQGV